MNSAFVTAMLAAALIAAVPLILAALGEAVGEKAGLLNLGIEGMMLCGAFFAFTIAYNTNSAWQGILGGINAVIVGNYLTTLGRPAEADLELLDDLQMPIKALNATL